LQLTLFGLVSGFVTWILHFIGLIVILLCKDHSILCMITIVKDKAELKDLPPATGNTSN